MSVPVVRRFPLGGLRPGVEGVLVVAVVIAKSESRTFRTRRDGAEKIVARMTVRDSPDDFANVTLWLERDTADEYDSLYHVGDVVQLSNPKVVAKDPSDPQERFVPQVSSNVSLIVSAPQSRLFKYDPSYSGGLSDLIHIPTKSTANFCTLSDVSANLGLQEGDYVDVLAAVASVSPIRTFRDQVKGTRQVREVGLFDQSGGAVTMKLWGADMVEMADWWIPRKDVLFLADVRIDFDKFRNTRVITATTRTIVTPNPQSAEVDQLVRFAVTADIPLHVQGDRQTFDYLSVKRVASVATVLNVLEQQGAIAEDATSIQLAVIIYGFITKFDLDGDISRLVSVRCSECSFLIPGISSLCTNPVCRAFDDKDFVQAKSCRFNLRMDISDFTGSLPNCRIDSGTIERLVEPLDKFCQMTSDERTNLKWLSLLEPVKIWVVVKRQVAAGAPPVVVVVNWMKVSMEEVASKAALPPGQ